MDHRLKIFPLVSQVKRYNTCTMSFFLPFYIKGLCYWLGEEARSFISVEYRELTKDGYGLGDCKP